MAMVHAQNHRERALAVARDQGIARSRDFESVGIPRIYLQRLRDEGLLTQPGRGLTNSPTAKSARITVLPRRRKPSLPVSSGSFRPSSFTDLPRSFLLRCGFLSLPRVGFLASRRSR